MKRNITLTIPNDSLFLPLAMGTVEELMQISGFKEGAGDLLTACGELLENAIRYAYPEGMDGLIDIDILLQPHGVQVTVHDMGLPFNFDQYMESGGSGGLMRIAEYVDEFRFSNRGREGKAFTIFKAFPSERNTEDVRPYSDLEDTSPASDKPASIVIRDFRSGDGEAISRLIYSNYTYSYFKAIFYYPKKIREMNEKGEIASVVAQEKKGKIVGHFALVRVPDSRIAEVGVAVVHPDYKGHGIMNAMLARIMERAEEMRLSAVFGEALMMHPYSQRANLRHGFGESALILGLVPESMSLTDSHVVHTQKRSAVLVGFKVLEKEKKRRITVPSCYRKLIMQIYANNHLDIVEYSPPGDMRSKSRVGYHLSAYNQGGTLIIEAFGEDMDVQIHHYLHRLYRKHVDMIYADINLMKVAQIDKVVELLKSEGFVFSGILFYRKKGDDYLRMQLPNSDTIETEQLVCHSRFCHELSGSILRELEAGEMDGKGEGISEG